MLSTNVSINPAPIYSVLSGVNREIFAQNKSLSYFCKILLLFLIIGMFLSECGHVYVNELLGKSEEDVRRGCQKRVSDLLELEFQEAVSHLRWVLGSDCGSFVKPVSASSSTTIVLL